MVCYLLKRRKSWTYAFGPHAFPIKLILGQQKTTCSNQPELRIDCYTLHREVYQK